MSIDKEFFEKTIGEKNRSEREKQTEIAGKKEKVHNYVEKSLESLKSRLIIIEALFKANPRKAFELAVEELTLGHKRESISEIKNLQRNNFFELIGNHCDCLDSEQKYRFECICFSILKEDEKKEKIIVLSQSEKEILVHKPVDDPELLKIMEKKGISFDSGDILVEVDGKKEGMVTQKYDFGTETPLNMG